MKLAWKIVGIAAGILLLLGLALIVAALVTGGSLEGIGNNVPLTGYQQDFGDALPETLHVESRMGRLRLLRGETLRVEADNVLESGFVCTLENGALTVREDWNIAWADNISRLLSLRRQTPEIRVYLPEGLELKDTRLVLSAGEMELEELHTDTLDMKLLAGSLRCEGLCAQRIGLELRSGEAYLAELYTEALEADIKSGSLALSGTVARACRLDMDSGSANMKLTGDAGDYAAALSAGVGEILYGDTRCTLEQTTVGRGEGSMTLSALAGRIRVQFYG